MSLLLDPEASPNGSDAAPATKPAAKPNRSRADAQLGVMDEDEADDTQATTQAVADVMPEGTEATAQDQLLTGEEGTEADEPTASLEEQTETRNAEDGTRNGEAEADGEHEDDREELPRGVRKKLSRQQDRIERLEEELEAERAKTAEAAKRPDDSNGPVSITDAELKLDGEIGNLRARRAKVSEALRHATLNGQDRVSVKLSADAEPIEVSVAEAEQALEALGDRMGERKDDLRALRRDREATRQQMDQLLRERFPWTADRQHKAAARVDTILQRYPALKNIPEARYWLACTLEHEYWSMKQAKENGNGHANAERGTRNAESAAARSPAPPAPRPPARATRPAASPLPVNGQRAQLGAAQQRFAKSGDDQSGKELIGQLLAQ